MGKMLVLPSPRKKKGKNKQKIGKAPKTQIFEQFSFFGLVFPISWGRTKSIFSSKVCKLSGPIVRATVRLSEPFPRGILRNEFPGAGPKSPKRSQKRVKIDDFLAVLTLFWLRFDFLGFRGREVAGTHFGLFWPRQARRAQMTPQRAKAFTTTTPYLTLWGFGCLNMKRLDTIPLPPSMRALEVRYPCAKEVSQRYLCETT